MKDKQVLKQEFKARACRYMIRLTMKGKRSF